ncbi:MAG: Sapep family Mn(2+)-dependent dipeptidase [Collinsella sp.]|nr:Sapep family Mn(2+)-dependent dipeptidase [Collinsella sp.]
MDRELECRIDRYIEEVWEDVVSDISELVSHPSIADADTAQDGSPFGPSVRGALDCALGIAERLGYEVSDDEGYMGIADIPGRLPGHIATIAHVDVVPAGPGWRTDPFEMARREGWLLGRGVIDDKGPAVLSLYAGAFLLHEGIVPRHGFRALLGCDEEVGMTDVHHYLEGHEEPLFLFTPDAEFPVCNAEKGCFGATFIIPLAHVPEILSWGGAEATNAIPGQSVLELALDATALPVPMKHADRITIEPLGPGRSRITALGIGGHASLPEGTINAIGLLVGYLIESGILGSGAGSMLELMGAIHADAHGTGLGIAAQSPTFGALTCNAGTVCVNDDGAIEQTIDVRYPDTITADELLARCSSVAAAFGASVAVSRSKPPFSVDSSSPQVQTLLRIYRDVTGREAEPFAMGGGTYARNFERAVSFGPEESDLVLPPWAGSMHGPNEAASEELLRRALKIYVMAILKLMELDCEGFSEPASMGSR